jgi:hypothetical protein
MVKLGYVATLVRELFGFAKKTKAYWVVPVVALLLVILGAVAVGETAAPFIYTLF